MSLLGHRQRFFRAGFFFRFLVFVDFAGVFFARFPVNSSDNSYASSSQSVIGASTSSRCVTWMTCATFDREEAVDRRT